MCWKSCNATVACQTMASSTPTEGSLLGITCNVAGDPGIDTEASAAAMAIQQEMQQQEVIEKPEKLGGGTGPGGTWSHRDFVKNPKKLSRQVRGGKTQHSK